MSVTYRFCGTVTIRLKAWAARWPVAWLVEDEGRRSLDLDLLEGEGDGEREDLEAGSLVASTPSCSMLFSTLGVDDT